MNTCEYWRVLEGGLKRPVGRTKAPWKNRGGCSLHRARVAEIPQSRECGDITVKVRKKEKKTGRAVSH